MGAMQGQHWQLSIELLGVSIAIVTETLTPGTVLLEEQGGAEELGCRV